MSSQSMDMKLGKSVQEMNHFIQGLSKSTMDSREQKNIFREIYQHFSQ